MSEPVWKMEKSAVQVCRHLAPMSDQKLPPEIMRLDPETAAITFDIGGVDYMIVLSELGRNRPRPTEN